MAVVMKIASGFLWLCVCGAARMRVETSGWSFTAVIQMFLMTLHELQISLSFIGKRLHLGTWKMTLFDHL